MEISRRLLYAVLVSLAICLPLSAQTARLVGDLNPGPNGSSPAFQELAGAAWFLTRDPTIALWRSDGSEEGTTLVLSELGGAVPYSGLVTAAGRLFWVEGSTNPPPGSQPTWLMTSDGTAAGTGLVALPPNLIQTNVSELVGAGRQAFFEGWVLGGGPAVARADGTAGGTRVLAEFSPATLGSICAFHESAAWLVGPAGSAQELWVSDGTPGGTRLVKKLSSRYPPYCNSTIRRLGRALVFVADDGTNGCSVWVSDGTTAGTHPVGLVSTSSVEMVPIASSRGIFLFTNGLDLWRTDGTESGTYLLKAGLHVPPLGAGAREGAYFTIQGDGPLEQLWFTDGTAAGTALLHDFSTPTLSAIASALSTANGRFLATYWNTGLPMSWSAWTSDGSPGGTTGSLQDPPLRGPGLPYRGMTLFVGAGSSGFEPYAVDDSGFSAPVVPTSLSLLTPCRVLDTRTATGFLGGPPIVARAPRVFPVGGVCGIPWTARALAANVTVTGATSDGFLQVHASDIGEPETSVINFRAGQTRANNATISLGPDAEFTVRFEAPTGQVHVIVDVVGWYE